MEPYLTLIAQFGFPIGAAVILWKKIMADAATHREDMAKAAEAHTAAVSTLQRTFGDAVATLRTSMDASAKNFADTLTSYKALADASAKSYQDSLTKILAEHAKEIASLQARHAADIEAQRTAFAKALDRASQVSDGKTAQALQQITAVLQGMTEGILKENQALAQQRVEAIEAAGERQALLTERYSATFADANVVLSKIAGSLADVSRAISDKPDSVRTEALELHHRPSGDFLPHADTRSTITKGR